MRRVKSNEISSSFLYFSISALPWKSALSRIARSSRFLSPVWKFADQVPEQKHGVGFPPCDVTMPHQNDAILSESAGLVCTQYVHAAEVLNGIETLDNYLAAAHG